MTVGADSPTIDEEALLRYIAPQLGLAGGEQANVRRFAAGHSNLTYLVEVGERRYVLRRPPAGPLPPTAHDVLREFRILQSLRGVRAPRPVLACEDPAVIGAPFYLMEFIDGFVVGEELPPELADGPLQARRDVGEELVATLVEIHLLDWRAAGLGGMARATGYIDRQLRRWSSQWEINRTRPIPALERLGHLLHSGKPESEHLTLVHGDYKLDNLIFSRTPKPRCLAVVDWEMAAIGDPLADLGYLLAFWLQPGEAAVGPLALGRASAEPGFHTRAELRDRYVELTGWAASDLRWYEALALWKLAILLEGSYRRYVAGTTDDPFFAELGEGIPLIAERALAIVAGAGEH